MILFIEVTQYCENSNPPAPESLAVMVILKQEHKFKMDATFFKKWKISKGGAF